MSNDYTDLIKTHQIIDDKSIKGFFGEYRFLSNFYLTDVYFEGDLYPSSENAYMAAKSLDKDIRSQFSKISPREAKSLGRKIELRPDWEQIKDDVMFIVVFDKFKRNPEIKQKLINTGERYLEELNFWGDMFWGVDYKTGHGQNMLGKILMTIREHLRYPARF